MTVYNQEEMMTRIILDTDPGIDDALALLLALASPEVELEAVTTVSGNVPVEMTTRNALALLTLAGHTAIPVARGCSYPLVRAPLHAAYVHGQNGLGEVVLPEPAIHPVPQHAVDLIIQKVLQSPGEITLVALGPVTNFALALRREPRIAQAVREVVMMGGALRVPGNTTPSAEFNVLADPHAAHAVLHAGWPVRLVSLDTTMQTPLSRAQVDTFTRHGGAVKTFIKQMLAYYFDVFAPQYRVPTFHMHDPLCLGVAFQPDFITWEPCYVDVELNGTLTLGETVAFFDRPQAPAPNIQASTAVDAERFVQFFFDRVGAAFP